MADSLSSVRTDLTVLKGNVEQVKNNQDRVDVTLDKLTDISNNLTKLVSVYANRLDMHDDSIKTISATLEKKRDDTDKKFDMIRDDIKNLERDILTSLKSEVKTITTDIEESQEALEQRVSAVEKYIWMGLGAVIIIEFLAGPIISALAKVFIK